MSQLEAEKKRGEELSQMRRASQSQNWWEAPIEELSLTQLQQLKSSYEELKKNLARQAENLVIQNTNSQQQFFTGSGSGLFPPNYETLRNNNNNIPAFNSNMNMMPQGQEYYNTAAPNMMIAPPGPAGYNPINPEGYNPNPQGYNPPIANPQGYNPAPNPSPQGYNPMMNPQGYNPAGPSDQFGCGFF